MGRLHRHHPIAVVLLGWSLMVPPVWDDRAGDRPLSKSKVEDLDAGCCPALSATFSVGVASADPIPAPSMLPIPEPHVQFGAGDGADCARAVVIAGARHESEGVRAERWWVYSKYPGSRIASQSVSQKDGKALDTITILTADGTSRAICFDITS